MWWVTLVALVLCLAGQVRLVFKHRDGWVLNSLGAVVFMMFFIVRLCQLFSPEDFILLLANVMFLIFGIRGFIKWSSNGRHLPTSK